jgi:hypothetical protein
MQSPPVEWVVGIGYLAAIDYIRSRGEADGDTLSEVVRTFVRRHPSGDALFTVAVFAGAEILRRHILSSH